MANSYIDFEINCSQNDETIFLDLPSPIKDRPHIFVGSTFCFWWYLNLSHTACDAT